MSSETREILADIAFETKRIAADFALAVYQASGGVFDDQLDHDKLIRDLGPRLGGAVAKRFIELRASMRNLYGLNPARLIEHMEMLQRGARRGWFRRGVSSVGRPT